MLSKQNWYLLYLFLMIWKPAGVFTGALRQNMNIYQDSKVPTLEKKKKKEEKTCWTVAARKHMSSRRGDKQSGKHMIDSELQQAEH